MITDDLQLRAKLEERFYNKRKLGVPTGERGGSPETDYQSGMAEKFVAEQLGCEFNDSILSGGDNGVDFKYRGYDIDVKWMGWVSGTVDIPRDSGRIIVDLHKLKSDIYVAVCGTVEKGFKILGWCWKKDLLNAPKWSSRKQDEYGRYARYALHTSEIRDFASIHQLEEAPPKVEDEWWKL